MVIDGAKEPRWDGKKRFDITSRMGVSLNW